jgi:hypothetical protein
MLIQSWILPRALTLIQSWILPRALTRALMLTPALIYDWILTLIHDWILMLIPHARGPAVMQSAG